MRLLKTLFLRFGKKTGNKSLKKVEKETIYLLTYKSRIMKKTMYNLGISATILVLISSIFKILHLPLASILLVLGIAMLSFGFVPLFFITKYKEQDVPKNKLMHILGFIAAFALPLGVLFKIMHWPGAFVLTISGLIFLFIGFLPLFFLHNYKESKNRLTNFGLLMILLFYASLSFAYMNISVSRNMIDAYIKIGNETTDIRNFIEAKNKTTYYNIESNQQDSENEIKGKAYELKTRSDELVAYIEDLKWKFVKEIDSRPEATTNNFHNMDYEAISTNFMIYSKHGFRLQEKIDEYRKAVIMLHLEQMLKLNWKK